MREVIKQMLEALEVANSCVDGYYIPKGKTHLPEIELVITAIKETLAQPEQHSEAYWKHEIDQAFCRGYEKGRASCLHDQKMAQPEQKRPPNCGTSFCSCIECVMEPERLPTEDIASQQEPVAVDCCGNCLRPKHEHMGDRCPKPYTTVWHAWDYPFPPDATTQQRTWVGLTDEVLVPLSILEAAESSLGSFCSDEGWGDEDMQNMDNLSAYIAQHKAAHGIKE